MPFCPNCGSYVSPGANICSCGTTFASYATHEKRKKHKIQDGHRLTSFDKYRTEGKKFMKEKNYIKAVKCFDKAIEINPRREFIYFEKGQACYHSRMYEEALECFKKSEYPYETIDNYSVTLWKGRTLTELHEFERAKEEFFKSIDIINWYFEKNIAEHKRQRWAGYEGIERLCKRELEERNVRLSTVYNDLASNYTTKAVYLNRNRHFKTSLEYHEKAIKLDKESIDNWNEKAITLEYMENYTEAMKYYDRALQIEKNETVTQNKARMIRDWCAKLFYIEGNPKKALDLITKAIDDLSGINTTENIASYRYLRDDIQDGINTARKCELLTNISKRNLITITGTQFCEGPDEFVRGTQFSLRKEPYNKFDSNAIAVYLAGMKIGYVANSDNTCPLFCTKASYVQNLSNILYVKYLVKYSDRFHIAKLVRK